jgi:hypothetical protein
MTLNYVFEALAPMVRHVTTVSMTVNIGPHGTPWRCCSFLMAEMFVLVVDMVLRLPIGLMIWMVFMVLMELIVLNLCGADGVDSADGADGAEVSIRADLGDGADFYSHCCLQPCAGMSCELKVNL